MTTTTSPPVLSLPLSTSTFVMRNVLGSVRRMPYENPYQDVRGKTETFVRDFWAYDAFSRGSADYAYEAKGIADAMSGFNVAFITDTSDRQLFMDIYKQSVLQEQMFYNNLVAQTHQDQFEDIQNAKYYNNALEVERARAKRQTDAINKLQADASVERQEDIKKMRAEREETIARLTKLKDEQDRERVGRYYLRRSTEQEPSINIGPEPPVERQFYPVIPGAVGPDPKQSLSLSILLGLTALGVLMF
jgi:hypothetical protein